MALAESAGVSLPGSACPGLLWLVLPAMACLYLSPNSHRIAVSCLLFLPSLTCPLSFNPLSFSLVSVNLHRWSFPRDRTRAPPLHPRAGLCFPTAALLSRTVPSPRSLALASPVVPCGTCCSTALPPSLLPPPCSGAAHPSNQPGPRHRRPISPQARLA